MHLIPPYIYKIKEKHPDDITFKDKLVLLKYYIKINLQKNWYTLAWAIIAFTFIAIGMWLATNT